MKNWRNIFACILLGVSIVFLVASVVSPRTPGDTVAMAGRVEKKLGNRLRLLQTMVEKEPETLPSDMVIYRYEDDILVRWNNCFTINNDDVSVHNYLPRLSNPRFSVVSPLSEIGPEWELFNFGSKWYLARSVVNGTSMTIMALELINNQDRSTYNGSNPAIGLGERYTIRPLTFSEGTPVTIDSHPCFKILYDSLSGTTTADAGLVILALIFFISGALLFLYGKRSLTRSAMVFLGFTIALSGVYSLGLSLQNVSGFFSPDIFADRLFYSLGSVVITNLWILLSVLCVYVSRNDIHRRLESRASNLIFHAICCLVLLGIFAHAFMSLRSIILNSTLFLELNRFSRSTMYTLVVISSYVTMLLSVPMLLAILRVPVDVFSGRARLVYSFATAVFIVVTSSVVGLRKEQERLAVWAARLAVDRDISMEMRLRRVESQIAGDFLIPVLCQLDNAASTIQNHLEDAYFSRMTRRNSILIHLLTDQSLPEENAIIEARLAGGDPLASDSRFKYHYSVDGRSRYNGLFLYYVENIGLVRLFIEIEPRVNAVDHGYESLLSVPQAGRVVIPNRYSFARYQDDELITFRGNYAYPTKMPDQIYDMIFFEKSPRIPDDSSRHFVNLVADDEVVIISRQKTSPFTYAIAIVFLTMLIFLALSLLFLRPDKIGSRASGYYQRRIRAVIMVMLVLCLVAMAAVSIIFVYRSTEDNLDRVMYEKINAIQTLVHNRLSSESDVAEGIYTELSAILRSVGEDTSSDIDIFTPDGRLILSTAQEVYERMILGNRIDIRAYDDIMVHHKRYCIRRARIGSRSYYCMYAPLTSDQGQVLAILASPYTEGGYKIERDAIFHTMTIFTVFIVLLLLARFLVDTVTSRMFKPLAEVAGRMDNTDIDNLEYLEYSKDDEIRLVVEAYNRMVSELRDSTAKLAQAERDKAWSGMARQVAHEIKNPLTPMKLQLQRIIRLKQKGDPAWESRFDEVAKLLLEHIELLADTAGEFSTFARLYSEKHTRVNLDEILQDEVSMFDSKSGVHFDYYGQKDSFAMAPRPQLTRVFVNLINNAVQALDGVEDARIQIALRNSGTEGYYDICFEDNGPGVDPSNIDKLFSPNFTTKSGGSGLGLAISRSILETCGAKISYSRSFTLGGACFTITYPK